MVADDMSGGSLDNINSHVGTYSVDLRKPEVTDMYIKQFKPEVVFHLAANAAENKAQFSPIDITSRNWNTFINTLVPFIKYGGKKFIFTSSIAVYGNGQAPFKETDRPEPEDLYGISKYAIEQALNVMSKVHGFEYVIARPHNVYGPRQNMKDPYRNVVTIFMNQLLQEKPYFIYGDGEQRRCFSFIDDVADALVNCMDAPSGSIYNIGADKDYSINELSTVIQQIADMNIRPIYIKDRPQEVKIATSDHTLAKKELGYKDKTTLRNGIEQTWQYCKNMGYQKPLTTTMELESTNLPENWK